MPFLVLNAVLALISIVGGIYLYDQLQHTRGELAEVEQCNRLFQQEYGKLQVTCELLRGEKEVWANQWQRAHDRARKAEQFSRTIHRGFRDFLAEHGLAAVVLAETGEVVRVDAIPAAEVQHE